MDFGMMFNQDLQDTAGMVTDDTVGMDDRFAEAQALCDWAQTFLGVQDQKAKKP